MKSLKENVAKNKEFARNITVSEMDRLDLAANIGNVPVVWTEIYGNDEQN